MKSNILNNVFTIAILISIVAVVVVAGYINPSGRKVLAAKMAESNIPKKQNSGTISLYHPYKDAVKVYRMDEIASFASNENGPLHIWLTNGEEIIFNGTWKVER